MDGLWFWIAGGVAAALVGMSKGGVPVVGMLAVPVLALVINPVAAAGLLLPVFVVSDVFGLWAYRRAWDGRVLAITLPGAVAGIGLGWATASLVPEAVVTLLVGLIGLAFAASVLVRRPVVADPRRAEVFPGLVWGGLAGFTSFVSHAGAPPWQVYTLPLGLSKATFAGTTTVFFAVVNAVKLVPYAALGQLHPGNLQVAAVLALPAVLAVFAGVWLVRWMPERVFFQLVTWALFVISLKLIWDGARGLI
jgi:uncharacterized membrane protein YfcA